ncbi:MAG: beta-lactamase family protein [Bacteroidetes bacterium]|nr:beta-lactamase family protein [Bacteroidota bacterium]
MKAKQIAVPGIWYILFCVTSCQQHSNLESGVDEIFKRFNSHTPGCAVAVVDHGKVVLQKGYGMANLEYDVPITSSSIFDIASVSKQFAGLAISTLIQEGKISLDDDIHKYLPDVPDFGKAITIRHLVHHTSGLRDWPEGLHTAGWRWDEVFSFQDIVRMVQHQKDLDFTPGERFSYSNTGYNLLARIVEKVTGTSFREWTDKNIFAPHGMQHSQFLDDHSLVIKNMAYSYSTADKVYRKNPNSLTAYGSSSLFTNVEDLSKWVTHFSERLEANDPVYTRMLETGVLNSGEKTDYAFGLAVEKSGGLRMISHTGGWAGYRTIIMNFPDEKLSIIVLGNIGEFNSEDEALKVAKLILKEKYQDPPNGPEAVRKMPDVTLSPDLAKKFVGIYQLGRRWFVTLTLEDGKLMTQANGEEKFPMVPKSDSVVWIEAYGSPMTFVTDQNGEVSMIRYHGINAKRITPLQTDPVELKQFAGLYYSEELETEYRLTFADKKLTLHHMRLGDFDLHPSIVMKDAADGTIGSLQFVRDKGKVSGFLLSGGRVQNIRFDKRGE